MLIKREGGSDGAASVRVNTVNGTASAGTHFTGITNQTVNFLDGQTSETITLTITDNATEDGNVAAQLVLDNPATATLGAITTLDFTIVDDEGYIQPLLDDALTASLASYGTANPQFVEYLSEIEDYISGVNTNNNDRNFFSYGGAVIPLAVFGPGALPTGWEANTKAFLLTELANFPVTDRNTTRLSGGDLFLACITVRDRYPSFFSASEWTNTVFPDLEAIADHLWTEHGNGTFLSKDTDENNAWLEIAYYSSLILPDGIVKDRMAIMFPNLFDWFKDRLMPVGEGTFAGGCCNESTSYIGQNVRYPSRILYILEKAGFSINAGAWHTGNALHHALMWMSDESGIWSCHDGEGHQSIRDGVYPADWDASMSVTNERTGRWTDSPLLNTQGEPAHDALRYFMDNVIPSDHAGGRNSKTANWLFRDNTAAPVSLASIGGLPTSYNPGKRGIYCAREDWNTGAVQFWYDKTQTRAQDHHPVTTSWEIWDNGRPVSHASSNTRTNEKTAPVSTMYIESFGGSGSAPEYFTFDTYPGAHGARDVQYGQESLGDFVPHGPEDILDFSDATACNLVTENSQRYWDDVAFGGQTQFLEIWNRTIRCEWGGIAFIYDYISMDVTDFADMTRRYTNHPEDNREDKLGEAYFNRTAMRLTRCTGVPTLSGGWYGWVEHGLQCYYRSVGFDAPTMRIVNEKTEAPWSSWGHDRMWSVHKIAHLQERWEGTATTGTDDIDFMGIVAWGETGETAPTAYSATDPGSVNYYGCGALHGGVKKAFFTTRDPSTAISGTIALTFTGMAPGAGTLVRGVNFDPAESWTASASGDTITLTAGSGTSPNADGVLEITMS